MGYPRFQRARAFKFSRINSGDVTVSTSLTALPSTLDLTIEAQVGDVLEANLMGLWDATSNYGQADAATRVSSTDVTYFSSGSGSPGANGVLAWYTPPNIFGAFCGPAWTTVGAGDISGGLVTVRFYGKTNSTTKLLYNSSTNWLVSCLKNLGPQDPN